jgi:DNA-directed RNA polymerase specialized sigma subunit
MTKEQLRQYRSMKIEICQLEERIINLEMMGHNDDITQPLRDKYREKLQVLIDGQLKIEDAIESLDPIERELMRLRYIDGAEWTDIMEVIHYEWTNTHRIHSRALNKIKNL